jgi:hypothetical protein
MCKTCKDEIKSQVQEILINLWKTWIYIDYEVRESKFSDKALINEIKLDLLRCAF